MIDFILRPIRRNFGRDKRFYRAVDDMFGFIAHNIELYKLALIHKSASVVLEDGTHINNERLEYLGDAVIESVTSEYLFIEFPDKDEGFMTQLRSKMVSRQTLNEVAKRIGLDDYVITHSSNNLSQKHIYGDAFEAMIGAIYLDQGYDFVNRLLINHIFVNYIKVENLMVEENDFKSRLIEWCQKNHHTIRFQTANDKNYSSSHPFFYSKVLIDEIEVGYGAGDSKKEAEQRASYSVSQGFSEADYTKIMDKLDSIEGVAKQRERRDQKTSGVREQREAKQPKPQSKTAEEQSSEPKAEPKHRPQYEAKPKVKAAKEQPSESETTEQKASQPQATEPQTTDIQPAERKERKTVKRVKAAKELKEVEEPAKPVGVVEDAEPALNVDNVAGESRPATENAVKSRRRRPAKSQTQKSKAESEKGETDVQNETAKTNEPTLANEVAPKSESRPRRRRAKAAEGTEKDAGSEELTKKSTKRAKPEEGSEPGAEDNDRRNVG